MGGLLMLFSGGALGGCTDADAFGCPAQTQLVGLAPPLGFRQYCVLLDAPQPGTEEGLNRSLANKAAMGVPILHGRWLMWHGIDRPSQEGFYERSRKHGLFRRWHANGEPLDEGRYRLDAKIGPWKEWYDGGQLRSVTRYTRGVMHGRRTLYHHNGKVSLHADYDRGAVAQWQAFDERGKFIKPRMASDKSP